MVFKSEPLLLMPQTGLTSFIFSNPNNVADDKPIFIDAETDKHITYGQLRNLVFRLNHGLRRIGFKKGDVLCIYSANKVNERFLNSTGVEKKLRGKISLSSMVHRSITL